MWRAFTARSFARSLAVSGLLVACGGRENGTVGGDAGEAPRTCDTDFTRFENAPRVSFRSDVMPVFGLACALSMCHGGDTPAADLYLGVRCAYDAEAHLACRFPNVPDPQNVGAGAEPLTQTVVDSVRSSLLSWSKTAPAVARVVPGKPEASFLVDKIAGTQGDRGYDCTAPEPPGLPPEPCGQPMPFGSLPLCFDDELGRFDALVTWIAQGAKDD